MRKYHYLAIAAGAALMALLPATAASADTVDVLTYGSAGGPNVGVGDVLNAGVKSGTSVTFYSTATGTTGVKCAVSNFQATVTANPPAPGTATESLTVQTFSSCTSNVIGVTAVNSVTVSNLPYSVSVTSAGAVTVSGTISTTVSLRTLLGTISCTYASSSLSGSVVTADNGIKFTNQQFTKTSGPGTCFSTGFFSVEYAPVTDSSQTGSPLVYTN